MTAPSFQFHCNRARAIAGKRSGPFTKNLFWDSDGSIHPNVRLQTSKLLGAGYNLDKRLLDLLEIAAYVYCADRKAFRGPTDSLHFAKWARDMRFNIRVRDFRFWNRRAVKDSLASCLTYLSGDSSYSFEFQRGFAPLGQTSFLFESAFPLERDHPFRVVLFSGGIDSLAGALEVLANTSDTVILASHVSGRPSIPMVLNNLANRLVQMHPGRVYKYHFDCGLSRERRNEETQRTRSFLFLAFASVLARQHGKNSIHVYENGITSLNLKTRNDIVNGRASRTTHPRAVNKIREFLELVFEEPFLINTDFFWKTKSDVLASIVANNGGDLLSSTISCSRVFRGNVPSATHCGVCTQCVDRRFAAYASGYHSLDTAGLYDFDFLTDELRDDSKGTVLDYWQLGDFFATANLDSFYVERSNELSEVLGELGGLNENDTIQRVWELCNRHGMQVNQAISTMRQTHQRPGVPLQNGSLLTLI
jgi:7-cyano-7-deazaguanine synthase in queuosine biosynthesis